MVAGLLLIPTSCYRTVVPADAGDETNMDAMLSPERVVQITASTDQTCARRASGVVVCWGGNSHGDLGDGTLVPSVTPVPVVGLTDAIDVAAGEHHTCAIRASGRVVCWGDNTYGTIGDGTVGVDRLTPVEVAGITDAVELTAGEANSCARRRSGEVACWGSIAIGDGVQAVHRTPSAVYGLNDAVQIASGFTHTCALRSSRGVVCWGFDGSGELGDGVMAADRLSPVAVVGLTDAVEVKGGFTHSCARRASGQVVCWGAARFGDGTMQTRLVPGASVPGLADAVEIAAGLSCDCVRRASGGVICWGYNYDGETGDGTIHVAHATPVNVLGLSDAVQITAGHGHFCALRASGEVDCWGRGFGLTPTVVAGL